MTDVSQIASLAQRDVEQLFAITAMRYPVYTCQVAGWLPSTIIIDREVRKLWEVIQLGVQPNMTDDQADCVVTEAMLNSSLSITGDQIGIIEPMPQVLAQEIARRHYIHAVSTRLGTIAKAITALDDVEIRRIVAEINNAVVVGTNSSLTAHDAGELFEKAILYQSRVINTAIPNLDRAMGGLERQTEIVVAARPSMGKTAIMWQMARNMAVSAKKVAFYSIEMSAVSLWARAACPAAGVTWRDVKAGSITDHQRELLLEKSRELQVLYGDFLHIDDKQQTTDSIWQDCASWMPDVVFVDHLRLVGDRGENENKRQGRIAQRLKDMAKSLNCAVVIAAQLNRGVEERNDKIPLLSDLRDCGEIEEVADTVLALYRPDYYDPPIYPTDQHYTEVWVRKNRDGVQNGLVKLNYDTKKQWFEPFQSSGDREGPSVFLGQE